jgi:hypothetical protein
MLNAPPVSVTVASEYADGLVALTAVIVAPLIFVVFGAVHRPLFEIVPALADQATAVSLVFFTTAENCTLPPGATDAVAGEI